MLCEVVVKLSVGAIFSTHHDDKQHLGSACVGVEQTVVGNVLPLSCYWRKISDQPRMKIT